MRNEKQINPAIRRLLYLIFVVISTALFLLCAELAARVFEVFGPRTFVYKQYDPLLGISPIPNRSGIHRNCFDGYVSINSHGMRDAPRTIEKTSDSYRIGIFGDSISEGLHVFPEQVVTRRLEAKLKAKISEPEIEVLNFSIGGVGTLQEFLRYQRDGAQFDLDLVIVFLTDNDLANNLPNSAYDGNMFDSPEIILTEEDGYQIVPPTKPPFYDTFFFLNDNSVAFRTLYKIYYHYVMPLFREDSAPAIEGFPPLFSILDRQNPDGLLMWDLVENILTIFAQEVEKDGGRLVLVHSGYDIYEVNLEIAGLIARYEEQTGHPLDQRTGTRRFKEWGQRENVSIFNFGEYLYNYRKEEDLSERGLNYSCDAHFNPEGHNVMANFLYDVVVSTGIADELPDDASD